MTDHTADLLKEQWPRSNGHAGRWEGSDDGALGWCVCEAGCWLRLGGFLGGGKEGEGVHLVFVVH